MTSKSLIDGRIPHPRQSVAGRRPSNAPGPITRENTLLADLDATPEGSRDQVQDVAAKPGHQRFVLTDPVAFRYLEEDASTLVLERRTELHGYECYVVEQWTTSRTHPTFVITTYTGDPSHTVIVGVLSVPTNERSWSPRLRVYFKALNQFHARRRQTPLGILMVTNLSGFPSSLTVIPVPDGDLRKHRFDFFVNENLKRLGCSGRIGLAMTPPVGATIAKFHQLYRTSEKNDIYKSVIELVKLCQSALMLFDKLEIDYADGLLCDVTERAISDWWVEIGSEYYSAEPHDGILGPTTVAGLLGLLMGARNRLHAVGAPVAKDAFDVEAIKRGIGHFQKSQRIARTRRLDRPTLTRLHKATQRAAEHEGWTVPKVLKNTAAELSGKGGEMVMDAVGRRDRAGIAEIETCEMDRFVQLLYGDRPKWLWFGKPLKKTRRQGVPGSRDHKSEPHKERQESKGALNEGLVFKPDENGGFQWTARKSTADGMPAEIGRQSTDLYTGKAGSETDSEDNDHIGVIRRATGFKNEAKSGLGKFKGAVGLKIHQRSQASVDNDSPVTPVDEASPRRRPLFRRAQSSPTTSPSSPRSPTIAEALQQRSKESAAGKIDATSLAEHAEERIAPVEPEAPEPKVQSNEKLGPISETAGYPTGHGMSKESLAPPSYREGRDSDQASTVGDTVTAEASIAGSISHGFEPNEVLPTGPETEAPVPILLKRTVSFSQWIHTRLEDKNDESHPRHLSFSLAEESVLTWTPPTSITDDDQQPTHNDPFSALASESLTATESKRILSALTSLHATTYPWTTHHLHSLDALLSQLSSDETTLEGLHAPRIERVNHMAAHSEGVLREQRERLEEGVREIETLGSKLQYEIDGLRSRVEDVEAGVGDFEKGVGRVEERVGELERSGKVGEGGGAGGRCGVM